MANSNTVVAIDSHMHRRGQLPFFAVLVGEADVLAALSAPGSTALRTVPSVFDARLTVVAGAVAGEVLAAIFSLHLSRQVTIVTKPTTPSVVFLSTSR